MSSQRTFAFVLVILTAGACHEERAAPPAPGSGHLDRKLTRAECVEGVDHAIALFEQEPAMTAVAASMRQAHATHVAQCLGVATVRDHLCLMQAKTSYELGLCPMPGTR